jgi:cytoskeletal protein CcmA (bactofilin family)
MNRPGLWLTAILLAVLGFAAIAAEASAATRTGNAIAVGKTETVEGDLTAVGRTVRISGVVNGDVLVFAETVSITGTVNGSVTGLARSLKVSGTVLNSVRLAADELIISGTVGGDVLTAARQTTLTRGSNVAGNVHLAGGDLAMRGTISGDVLGNGNDVAIDGAVTGNVSVSAASVTVTRNGSIAGSLEYASDQDAIIFDANSVSGTTERTAQYRALGGPNWFSAATSLLVRLFIGLATGLFLLLLLPAPVIATAETIRSRMGGSAMMGFITALTWPLISAVLLVVIVGIPLMIIGTVSLVILAWLSQVFVGVAVGRMILPSSWKESTRGYNILALAIGMSLIGLIRALPLPYVSLGVAVFVGMVGVGGFLLAMNSAMGALRSQTARAA